MNHEFWHQKWQKNQIGFHETEVNAHLKQQISSLVPAADARVFVPLCGKSNDLGWLADQGYHVLGCELSQMAVEAFFDERDMTPEVTQNGPLQRYAVDRIEIFAGDIFELQAEALGRVDAIFDRAALVALPEDTRRAYARHLAQITATAPQLLISFDYDTSRMQGPPFSVTGDEIHRLYDSQYQAQQVSDAVLTGPMAERCDARETVWTLTAPASA